MTKQRMRGLVLIITGLILVLIAGCAQAPMPINRADLDFSIDPGEDFYLYANGGWMESNPLPADKSRFGTFDLLREENSKKIKDLIEKTMKQSHPEGSIAQKIGDFFTIGVDEEKAEADGYAPIEPFLDRITNIETLADVQAEITAMHKQGAAPLFRFFGGADRKNSDWIIGNLSQGGLGMGDRDYYTSDDPRSKDLRKAYLIFAARLFELIGEDTSTSAASAQTVMEIETRLAEASMTRLERRNPFKTYNKMDVAGLSRICRRFDWNAYFDGLGIDDIGDLNVGQPDFFKQVNDLMHSVSVEDWKAYLRWNVLRGASPLLSSDFVNANFDFYGKAMSGQEEMEPRWKRVLNVAGRSMGMALGKVYVDEYFPPDAKDRMVTLVGNLKKALAHRIENLEWMGDITKEKAHAKLDAMSVKIGYPDKWRDYSGLEIKKDSYFMNALRANTFNTQYNRDKINKPVDREEWRMPPHIVNAYYSPSMNEICFPAGILQPPFFYLDSDDAPNYGAIGVVIGHEMTHGFDDQGRNFDKDGNMTDWWTTEDAEKFKARSEVLVNQFNEFVVLDTVHADGKLTLGENISDLGGLNISLTAYNMSLEGQSQVEPIGGFTDIQRFFLAYAHVWGQNIRDKEILRRTKEDVHSLGRFRVIGPLRNMPEFHAAFDVQPDEFMYLPEGERASIW